MNQHLDILQSIEFVVMRVYRQHSDLTDQQVNRAYEALIGVYQAEQDGKATPASHLTALEQQVYDGVRSMCEWRMGRGQLPDGDAIPLSPVGLEVILACLKRLHHTLQAQLSGLGYLESIASPAAE